MRHEVLHAALEWWYNYLCSSNSQRFLAYYSGKSLFRAKEFAKSMAILLEKRELLIVFIYELSLSIL